MVVWLAGRCGNNRELYWLFDESEARGWYRGSPMRARPRRCRDILGGVTLLDVGDVHRFPDAEHLAGYAGTTPRLGSTGGKLRDGRLHSDVKRYLKSAYREAANIIASHQQGWSTRPTGEFGVTASAMRVRLEQMKILR